MGLQEIRAQPSHRVERILNVEIGKLPLGNHIARSPRA
jgi:hypothetical protein